MGRGFLFFFRRLCFFHLRVLWAHERVKSVCRRFPGAAAAGPVAQTGAVYELAAPCLFVLFAFEEA